MNSDDQGGTTLPPWQLSTVYGQPYELGGYSLTPVARVLTYAVGRGTLQTHSMSGWAAGLVRVKPVAIIVRRDGREWRIAVTGALAGALGGMLAAGAAITLLLWVVRLLARRLRQRETP